MSAPTPFFEPRAGWFDAVSAAEALGITAEELLTLAGEDRAADAPLDAAGWRFHRKELRLATPRAAARTTDDALEQASAA